MVWIFVNSVVIVSDVFHQIRWQCCFIKVAYSYSLFMLIMPESHNRKYYIIGMHVINSYGLSREHSKYLVFPCNSLPLHAVHYVVFVCVFAAYCGPTLSDLYCYFTTDILCSYTTVTGGRHDCSGKIEMCNVYNYTESKKSRKSCHSVEVQQENS